MHDCTTLFTRIFTPMFTPTCLHQCMPNFGLRLGIMIRPIVLTKSLPLYQIFSRSITIAMAQGRMCTRVSHFSKFFTKHFAQEICHYLGYNNALSTFSEFSFAVYYLKIESEIYKGNSEKYKGKKLKQLSVFSP